MGAHTFFTWKLCGFGYLYQSKDFWQILLGVFIISCMPAESKAVRDYWASKDNKS